MRKLARSRAVTDRDLSIGVAVNSPPRSSARPGSRCPSSFAFTISRTLAVRQTRWRPSVAGRPRATCPRAPAHREADGSSVAAAIARPCGARRRPRTRAASGRAVSGLPARSSRRPAKRTKPGTRPYRAPSSRFEATRKRVDGIRVVDHAARPPGRPSCMLRRGAGSRPGSPRVRRLVFWTGSFDGATELHRPAHSGAGLAAAVAGRLRSRSQPRPAGVPPETSRRARRAMSSSRMLRRRSRHVPTAFLRFTPRNAAADRRLVVSGNPHWPSGLGAVEDSAREHERQANPHCRRATSRPTDPRSKPSSKAWDRSRRAARRHVVDACRHRWASAKWARGLDRRRTRIEEVRSKIQDQVGLGDIEVEAAPRPRRRAWSQPAQGIVCEGLVDNARPAAPTPDTKAVEDSVDARSAVGPEKPRPAGRSFAQLLREHRLGIGPGDRLKPSVRAARHRALVAIRMVGAPDSSLSSRAQPSAVDRVLRVALELHGASPRESSREDRRLRDTRGT